MRDGRFVAVLEIPLPIGYRTAQPVQTTLWHARHPFKVAPRASSMGRQGRGEVTFDPKPKHKGPFPWGFVKRSLWHVHLHIVWDAFGPSHLLLCGPAAIARRPVAVLAHHRYEPHRGLQRGRHLFCGPWGGGGPEVPPDHLLLRPTPPPPSAALPEICPFHQSTGSPPLLGHFM